ncbi:MAG: NADP-dependent malic enzyme [Candidatus Atribacteria bacterium]|nr:NADP-dependent malic enzyme [Candidatus Atribacteria bacterium]
MERKREEDLRKPFIESLKLHAFYQGKIEINLKCPVRSYDDFALWYTPGVAEVSRRIFEEKSLSFQYTNRWNSVAVVSDGSRVLGLGNIGPEAALPVMEGKALLFRYLGGVDAVPLCVKVEKPHDLIDFVTMIEPSFGGINLEDIAQPVCFEILEELKKKLRIPVWHDDQQGTALVVLAGLLGALDVVGKKKEDVRVTLIGAGASNVRIAHLLMKAGVKGEHIVLCDSKGILSRERRDLEKENPWKWELCCLTNGDNIQGGKKEAIEGSDVLIALSAPGPGVILPEWVQRMNRDAIVFACANPTPEIWPWEAKAAGARVVATGRSDFPNQINNSLGFPGLFRGVLSVRARAITDEMCVEAARALYHHARSRGLSEEYIVPSMEEWEVYIEEAKAVALKAQEQGLAERVLSVKEIEDEVRMIIERARSMVQNAMEKGYIPLPAEER